MAEAQKGLNLKLMNENMISEGLKKVQTARQGWPGSQTVGNVCSRPDRDEVIEVGAWSGPPRGQRARPRSVLSPVHLFTPYSSLGGRPVRLQPHFTAEEGEAREVM